MMIGLLPAGIKQGELTELWGSTDWKPLKQQLINSSMLVYRPTEKLITILPFMATRAFELLEENDAQKTEFHLKCCKFYKDYLLKVIDKIASNDFDLNELVEREANIWACIYRGINRKKHTDEYDSESNYDKSKFNRSMTYTLSSEDSQNDLLPANKHFETLMYMKKENAVIHEESEYSSKSCSLDSKDEGSVSSISDETLKEIKRMSSISLEPIALDKEATYDKPIKSLSHSSSKNISSTLLRSKTMGRQRFNSFTFNQNSDLSTNSDTRFTLESLLVVYYVCTAIRISKYTDGLKAIEEYSKKTQLCTRCQAHLKQYKAVIDLLTRSNLMDARLDFKAAFNLYQDKLADLKGQAICQYAILRVRIEMDMANQTTEDHILSYLQELRSIKERFEKVGYTMGMDRVTALIQVMGNADAVAMFAAKTPSERSKRRESKISTVSQSSELTITQQDIQILTEVIHTDDGVVLDM